ncbi:MAG TPA: hypothetical protein VGG75_14335 [Trebonia sp.]|jgi:hypothetical protein
MAAVSDGTNPGRSSRPERQSPGRKRNGRAESGVDPTNENGQVPSEIFGFSQTYSTGARGSSGGHEPTDVTLMPGQLDTGLAQVSGSEITSTGAPGSTGARSGSSGGETVTYTDFFGFMGQEHRESSATMHVDGPGDSTQFGDNSGFSGVTLPILQNARPTSSGAGMGHVRGAGKGL